MGVIQYHISILLKDGQVEDYRDGRYRRFFAARTYQDLDKQIISLLREDTTGKILLLLSHGNTVAHKELASTLGITSQAVTWHITRLNPTGIVKTFWQPDFSSKCYILRDDVSSLVLQHISLLCNK